MKLVILRWLHRRARTPRAPRAALALVMGAVSLTMLATPASPRAAGGASAAEAASGARGEAAARPNKLPDAPGPGEPAAAAPSSPALVAEGRTLYATGCASCHGLSLHGRRGIAPALAGVGPGPVDFYLATGRMPLESPRLEPLRAPPLYDAHKREAIVAYVASFGGPPAPVAEPSKGDLALGLHYFTLDCAGCHQIVARGGLTIGAAAPDLQKASAQQIAEAVRMGPYLMPNFDARHLDQHELNSIERYVLWTRHPDNAGGWGIYNLGPIPEGMVAWFLALASLVLVARLIGERTA